VPKTYEDAALTLSLKKVVLPTAV